MQIPPVILWPRVTVTIVVTLAATLVQSPIMIVAGLLGYGDASTGRFRGAGPGPLPRA